MRLAVCVSAMMANSTRAPRPRMSVVQRLVAAGTPVAQWSGAVQTRRGEGSMKGGRGARFAPVFAVFVLAALAVPACRKDTTTAPGALANVTFDAPDSARSGESILVDVRAVSVGINNVHNARVDVT